VTQRCTAKLFPRICVPFAVGCLLALAGCGGGGGSTRDIIPPPAISVSLQSPPASLQVGTSTSLTAVVLNDSANPPMVSWTVTCGSSACGSFNPTSTASGVATTYTAPSVIPTPNTVTVTATSVTDPNKSASAKITISPTPVADFFVAPNGNDTWSGTISAPNPTNTDGPFGTIARAQTAVRGVVSGRTSSVVVMVRAGTYFLTQPLSFTAADSGKAAVEVFWQNYPGETPVITGGKQITSWTHGSGNIWTATLPSGTHYFEQLFYNGERRLRPRVGSPPLVGTYYQVAATVSVPSPETNCPDLGEGSPYECFDRFKYSAGDPISATWANLSPPSGNPCGAAAGPFPSGDIALYSFEQMGTSKMLISCIDTTNTIIYLTGPIRMDLTTSGFVAGHRYLVENVKNALTQPGQWFLDRSNATWKLDYLANTGEDPSTDTVIIPQATQVMIATGLQYVTFQGLTFEHDNFTVPSEGYAYMRLDQGITSAVSCQNCQNVTFDGDVITQTTGTGIDFTTTSSTATTAHNMFVNGGIFDVASHGIRIGLLAANSDTTGNVPQFTTIENTVIEGFGRVFPKGFGIAQGCNHDNLYTHNDIYDGYSGGINIGALNCPVGNTSLAKNNVASFNKVYNLGQGVTNDFGCVYFNTTPLGAVPPSGNQALNNVCHDVTDASIVDADGYGGQGVYIDNYTGNVNVENNLVYRVSGSTVAQTCGPQGVLQDSHNIIKNNILAFSRLSVKQEGCTPSSASNKLFEMTNNLIIYDKGNIQGGCYSCLNGDCASVLPATVHFQMNMYCYAPSSIACTLPVDRAAFYSSNDPAGVSGGCNRTTTYSTLLQWQVSAGEDVSSVLQNPFTSSSPTNNNYSLSGSLGVVGFVLFDPNQAGRTSTTIAGPTVPATFPAQSYAPSDF
jgi:hypothetical protein